MKDAHIREEYEKSIYPSMTEPTRKLLLAKDREGYYAEEEVELAYQDFKNGWEAALASQVKSVPDYASMVVMEFNEERVPEFSQGYQSHELLTVVTAERCKQLVELLDAKAQQADKVRELENTLIVTRNKYGTMVTGLPNYVIDYLSQLKFVLRNGELADYDSELANRLQELHDWLEAMKGE